MALSASEGHSMDYSKKQAGMTDQAARKKLVWQIDAKLQEDVARPIIVCVGNEGRGRGCCCYVVD